MELWFTEEHTEDVRFSIKIEKTLHTEQSEFQRIDVFESKEFGRCLTLDGLMMVTEKDEFIYHDMIVHVPMATNPNIKNVLVIGAGDGGTVRELTRYTGIEHIDMVEIDERVVEVCREYLPQLACKFDDPRVTLYFEDGLRFIRTRENEYDLIIVDSTDPFGPGEGLFTKEFYGNCYKALNETGILVNQAHIPTYPSGHWLFGFASKKFDPVADLDADAWNALGLKTKYYNTRLHVGAFALPNYVIALLET